ncbi:alpha/beta hydrolase [Rhodobacterales bacterium]|nr:alpha/beta hydrolase [Rhodobacterales bacterium]
MATYVLVHGAWHTGTELEATGEAIRTVGHEVYCPTVAGNRPGETKDVGLEDAIGSIAQFLEDEGLADVILTGHSYGGMIITGVCDRVPERIRRLVYVNAFVPNDGECLDDLTPPHYPPMFRQIAAASSDNTVALPYPVWREVFINDADADMAEASYAKLNAHPYRTFTDPISLSRDPAEFETPKSYVNCTEDTAMPHSHPWHPRLSEKLGLFRLVQTSGSHELLFTDPSALADAIIRAGRD